MDVKIGCGTLLWYSLDLFDQWTKNRKCKLNLCSVTKICCPQIDRYINILMRLGHENATIDYLKMDVEGAELQFFEDVFTNTPEVLKNIKQIGMEIHTKRDGRSEFYASIFH